MYLNLVELGLAFLATLYVNKATQNKRILFSGISLFFIVFYLYLYVGSVLIITDENYGYLPMIESASDYIKSAFWIAFAVFFLTNHVSKKIHKAHDSIAELSGSSKISFLILYAIFTLVVAYYIVVHGSSVLSAMISNPSLIALAREGITTNLNNYGAYSTIFIYYYPLIWSVLYIAGYKKLGVFGFILNMIGFLSTGQKSPLVYLGLYFLYSKKAAGENINMYKIFIYCLVFLIALFSITFINNVGKLSADSIDAFFEISSGILRRMFYVGPIVLSQYLEIFPSTVNYLGIFYEGTPPARLIYRYFYFDGVEGSLNTAAIANFHAFYGDLLNPAILYIPLLIAVIFVGIMLRMLVNNNAIYYSLYAGYSITWMNLNLSDWYSILPGFIWSYVFILGSIFVISKLLHPMTARTITVNSDYSRNTILIIIPWLYVSQGLVRGFLQ